METRKKKGVCGKERGKTSKVDKHGGRQEMEWGKFINFKTHAEICLFFDRFAVYLYIVFKNGC